MHCLEEADFVIAQRNNNLVNFNDQTTTPYRQINVRAVQAKNMGVPKINPFVIIVNSNKFRGRCSSNN